MGQDIQQEWHYQFLGDNGNVKILADRVNDFFLSIAENFSPLSPLCPTQHVPNEFLVSEAKVYRSLSSPQVAKSVGPDELPNKVLKEFAVELSPVIQDIYNQSIKGLFKRMQHVGPTSSNIVVSNMLGPFEHHVGYCCIMLDDVGSSLILSNCLKLSDYELNLEEKW